MHVADDAYGCCDGYAFEVLYVLRFEVRVVKYQVVGHGAANSQLVGGV